MVNRFLDYLKYELNRAPLTVEAYGTDIAQFQDWLTSDTPENTDFCSVTSSDIRAWLSFLARKGESPRTIRRKVITLRSFYRWMVKTKQIKKSPVAEVTLPKISKPLPDLVKPDEIEMAIENLEKQAKEEEDPELMMRSLIVDLLYSVGIRRAELIGINDEDISMINGELKVTGKRSKQRIIPVPQKLLDKIRKWQKVRDKEFENLTDEHPLFIKKGKRINPSQVYNIVREALSTSSARKKSPHALRHSFASGMLNGGAEIDSVREFLGHASLATTQIYTHISLNEIKKAYSIAHPRSSSKK